MDPVHGQIVIEPDGIRRCLGWKPRPGVFYDPMPTPLGLLAGMIEAELNDLKRDLLTECVAQWAVDNERDANDGSSQAT